MKLGQYIIVQRQNFTKLTKFSDLSSTVTLGKEIIELKNVEGAKFFQTFKMKFKSSGKKRLHELELCDSAVNLKEVLKSMESGSDNRNIVDDGKVSDTADSMPIHKFSYPRYFTVTNTLERRNRQHARKGIGRKGNDWHLDSKFYIL